MRPGSKDVIWQSRISCLTYSASCPRTVSSSSPAGHHNVKVFSSSHGKNSKRIISSPAGSIVLLVWTVMIQGVVPNAGEQQAAVSSLLFFVCMRIPTKQEKMQENPKENTTQNIEKEAKKITSQHNKHSCEEEVCNGSFNYSCTFCPLSMTAWTVS